MTATVTCEPTSHAPIPNCVRVVVSCPHGSFVGVIGPRRPELPPPGRRGAIGLALRHYAYLRLTCRCADPLWMRYGPAVDRPCPEFMLPN